MRIGVRDFSQFTLVRMLMSATVNLGTRRKVDVAIPHGEIPSQDVIRQKWRNVSTNFIVS